MTMTRIYDLAFEIDGDTIQLEQSNGLDEPDRISLHRIHLAHLAGEIGLLGDPDAERMVATLSRRLRILRAEIAGLAQWIESAPRDEDENNFPEWLMATSLLRLATSMVDDLPDLPGTVTKPFVTTECAQPDLLNQALVEDQQIDGGAV